MLLMNIEFLLAYIIEVTAPIERPQRQIWVAL